MAGVSSTPAPSNKRLGLIDEGALAVLLICPDLDTGATETSDWTVLRFEKNDFRYGPIHPA